MNKVNVLYSLVLWVLKEKSASSLDKCFDKWPSCEVQQEYLRILLFELNGDPSIYASHSGTEARLLLAPYAVEKTR